MFAAICPVYGGPETVVVRDIPRPEPGPGEIRIRVRAASVSSADSRIRGARFPRGFAIPARLALGLRGPRRPVLGSEVAGIVDALGPGAEGFEPGDAVFAFLGMRQGGHAEFARANAAMAAPLPPGFDFVRASAICFGGTTALYYLRDVAALREGERALVVGAAGTVGAAAVQIARSLGASVDAVCSEANAERVRARGAAQIFARDRIDVTQTGKRWDVVFDAVGAVSFAAARRIVEPGGRLLMVAGGLDELLTAPVRARFSGFRALGGVAPERPADVAHLAGLCASGAFDPPIDAVFPFARIAEAHARVDTGRKAGAVVVTMA
jgi:NADPH:quinone reductase-like Zn-dependent oxidoreductase